MAPEIEFCLLGPLIVRRRAVAVTVPRGKQRAILAMLLLNAGRVVPVNELAETLWVSGPPPSGPVAIQNYVMRLRNTLGDAGRARIITQPPGYLIRVQADELDLSRFEALLGAARAAAQDGWWDQAATQARESLQLWRGEPLTDVGSETLACREAPRLAELRLQALELRIDADLRRGCHTQVITELQQLAGVHPLRERLHGQLMLALYRNGRQADALAAYQHARTVLVKELGIEPGAGLRDLHQQILSADPALTATDQISPGQAEPDRATQREPASPVPRELPPAVPGFTGRTAELQVLTRLLDRSAGRACEAVVITAIGGTAGVGKTALAVQWAHQVADRFPGGQLYVNLRGYDLDRPMPAADALARFLRALGVPGQAVPPGEDERAARYRSLLAGQKTLIVLDNAGSVEQVRPLLPGTPSCTVVVTSRDTLAGLVARHGATRLELDLLPPAEAAGLLRELIGPRAGHDPGAAATLAEQCCRLPLALRVAAELAVARPDVPLAGLAKELADLRRRLDLLDVGGDPRTAVRAVLSWSYHQLDLGTARTFRLAGLHPGADFDAYAAAALASASLEESRRVLDALARAHLIQAAGPGRYSMHDLLRAYARELADVSDGEEEQNAALTRLFDHYLHAAATAMDALVPAERPLRLATPQPGTPAPPVGHATAAQAWLDAERASLVAITVHAAAHGWPGHATRLSATLYRYLERGVYCSEASTIHACACRAARDTGDQAAEAAALNGLGVADWTLGRSSQATGHFRQALALCRELGDRPGQARALNNLGIADWGQSRYPQATDHFQQALVLCRQTGDRRGEANVLNNLGMVELRLHRYSQATSSHEQALALCREVGDRTGEAYVLDGLARVALRQRRYSQATSNLEQALVLCRETGNRRAEASVLNNLGILALRQRRYSQATSNLEQALALCREIGDRTVEAETLNGLGEVSLTAGQSRDARTWHAAALALASQAGDKYQRACAHRGLGQACDGEGDPGGARRHWQRAHTLFTELGTPDAEHVRAEMTTRRPRSAPSQ